MSSRFGESSVQGECHQALRLRGHSPLRLESGVANRDSRAGLAWGLRTPFALPQSRSSLELRLPQRAHKSDLRGGFDWTKDGSILLSSLSAYLPYCSQIIWADEKLVETSKRIYWAGQVETESATRDVHGTNVARAVRSLGSATNLLSAPKSWFPFLIRRSEGQVLGAPRGFGSNEGEPECPDVLKFAVVDGAR